MQQSGGRKRLSKNLLQMKFMKRTKEKQELEIDNEERQNLFKNEISDAMRILGSRFKSEPSYAIIEDLAFGRMAFHGMNPDIEKMMEDERLRKEEAVSVKAERDVGDSEMAAHYSSLHNTIGRKFATKKSHESSATNPVVGGGAASGQASGDKLLHRGEKLLGKARQDRSHWTDGGSGSKKGKFMKPKD